MVCDQHGGLRPKSGGARERLIMTADQAAQMLVRMMEDTEVPSWPPTSPSSRASALRAVGAS